MIALPRFDQMQPRERLLAAVSAVVLVVVILDRLVLSPWTRHGRTVQQEIRRMEEALVNHDRLLTRRDHVTGELARYQRYFRPVVADDLQTAVLLKDVEDLAGQSHVTVGEIKPLGVETGAAAKHYNLEVRFQCTLDEWVEFVYRLETAPALYHVVRGGLSTNPNHEHTDRLEGYLRMTSATVGEAPAETGGAHAAGHP